MATVRTTAPRHDPDAADAKGKKKRKRSASASAKGKPKRAQTSSPTQSLVAPTGMFASMASGRSFADDVVRRKLDAHDKWQLCTQKMRRELEKVEQLADTAVMQVQDEATALRHMRDEVTAQAKTTVQYVETFQTDVTAVQKASVALENELQALKKKLRTLDQRVQQQGAQSIDEDFLMTQLTELQERYEMELVKYKDEYVANLESKQHAIDALKKRLHHVYDEYRQETEATSRVSSALEEELKTLKHRVHELDRDHRQTTMEKSGRWQLAIDDLNHRLGGLDRKLDDVIVQQEREPNEMRLLPPHHHNHNYHPPFSPPPPAPPAHDPMVHEKLHQLNGDVRRIADDFHRFTLRVDARHDDLHQEFMRQLRDLGNELFKTLDYDSRQHVVENKRVRDAVYDLDGHVRDLRDGMARMEDSIRRMAMQYPVRSQRPDAPWHDEPFVYVPSAACRDTTQQSFREDLQQVNRGRSRSRSSPRTRLQRSPSTGGRSPPPYHRPDEREPLPSSTLNASQPPECPSMFNAPSDSQVLSVSSSPPNEDLSMSEPSESARVSEPDESNISGSEQQRPTFRRTRRPKRPYEVIVIEDDDESAEEDVPDVAPNRAPPDIVEEDDDPKSASVVVTRIETVSGEGEEEEDVANDVAGRPDALTKMADVRYGALLYFCFGGAPNLDGEWTRYFVKLSPADCMDMARVTRFLDQYPALRSFPVSLTQFMIQATVVDVPIVGGSGSNVNEAVAVDNIDGTLVTTEFGNVVNAIRQAWALTLVVSLQKWLAQLVETGGDDAQKEWEIALNPVLGAAVAAMMPTAMEQHLTTNKVPDAWLHRQANALWRLLRQQHNDIKVPEFTGDMVASPGVYLFLLLFDVVHVNRLSPQSATFRLTNWGRSLVTQLWDHVLSKIPYLFFADCAWLEQQTDGCKLPPSVAFCHMVSALVAWNSIMDKAVEASPGFYAETVRLLMDMLHVNGVPVRGDQSHDNDAANWSRVHDSNQADIELVGVNTKLGELAMSPLHDSGGRVGLDGPGLLRSRRRHVLEHPEAPKHERRPDDALPGEPRVVETRVDERRQRDREHTPDARLERRRPADRQRQEDVEHEAKAAAREQHRDALEGPRPSQRFVKRWERRHREHHAAADPVRDREQSREPRQREQRRGIGDVFAHSHLECDLVARVARCRRDHEQSGDETRALEIHERGRRHVQAVLAALEHENEHDADKRREHAAELLQRHALVQKANRKAVHEQRRAVEDRGASSDAHVRQRLVPKIVGHAVERAQERGDAHQLWHRDHGMTLQRRCKVPP
ncbi:hypothetical protein FI667_g782, partial [Globisporangium splendens]